MNDFIFLTIKGRLGRDPEQATTKGGNDFVRFSVAASDRVKDPISGEWKNSNATWISVTVWDKALGARAMKLVKGQEVTCAGQFRAQPYAGKGGEERMGLNLTATEIVIGFPPKPKDASHDDAPPQYGGSDDIPF